MPRFISSLWVTTLSFGISAQTPWDLNRLSQPPKCYVANTPRADPLRAFFYDGLPWKGKPTRVFAFYGAPARKSAERLPAMILVHGGDGTAFADWVALWNARGYAAIAMDTCGSIPSKGHGEPGGAPNRPRHHFSGPPGWDAGFEQVDWPVEDQWTYHAVADILLANSLLRSFPEIDPGRIGITGISWGGYLVSIAASVDQSFHVAIPVYGCGFLGKDSYWVPALTKMGSEKSDRWLRLWDPSVYLGRAKMPFLWVSGTNDFAYPMDSLQNSYRLPHTTRTLVIRVRMPHSQRDGETPEEIHAFANEYLKSGAPLVSIRDQRRVGRRAWAKYSSAIPVVRAELNYTLDSGAWQQLRWQTMAADLDHDRSTVNVTLPEGVRVYYFNLIDKRGLIVSSESEVVP